MRPIRRSVVPSNCTYQLSGIGAYSSSSATGTVAIATTSACAWTAATTATFLHITSRAVVASASQTGDAFLAAFAAGASAHARRSYCHLSAERSRETRRRRAGGVM